MRNIIYITTAMDEIDFKEYLHHWRKAPNPSNQNFHNKLIRSLGINNNVDVISIRPFSRSLCDIKKLETGFKRDGNITWHYLEIKRNLFKKYISCQNEMISLIKKIIRPDTVFLTDTINTGLIHFVKHAMKKLSSPRVIGVVTDSPSNISGVGRSYAKYVLSSCCNFSGYIALTKELDLLYNKNNKPSMIMEGIVEDRNIYEKAPDENYFFFGGALMERYGIYNLIYAFQEFNADYPNYRLYIAGHHADEERLKNAIDDNENIIYLKMLPVCDVLRYEKYAVANINPRPFSEDLDRYSIPSKTIEYLVSGKPTICVKNSKLAKYFYEDIIWAKSDSITDLKEALVKVATGDKETLKTIGENGKEKALNNFSLKAINKRIENELFAIFDK